MDRPSPEIVNCPGCGANNPAVLDDCYACGSSLTVVIGPRPKVRRINLSAIMAAVAVSAVCLAPVRLSRWLSVGLSVLLIPATLTACRESYLALKILGSRRAIRWIIASLTNASLLDVVPS